MSGAVKGILKRALHQAFALFSLAGKPNIVPNDHSGWTALMAAAARGHTNTVALLLQNGADPNIRSKDGRTAIELARAEGHSEVVRKFSAIRK